MNVRLAGARVVVESDLVAPNVSRRSAQLLSRFTVREHGPAFWVALWALAAAAEFGALVPVIFGRAEPVPGGRPARRRPPCPHARPPRLRRRALRRARARRERRRLLVSAGRDERDFNVLYERAARGRAEHWNVPRADHTAAIRQAPVAYERRVVAFLDRHLRR